MQTPIVEIKKQRPKAPSNFHVVVNTNISTKQLNQYHNTYKKQLINDIRQTLKHIQDNIDDFQLDKITDKASLNVFSFNLEVGTQRGFLHVDGYMRFNKYTLLDAKRITDIFNTRLSDRSKGCYVNVKYVHDSIASVKIYSEKDNVKLI